jgi:hypothetical protein
VGSMNPGGMAAVAIGVPLLGVRSKRWITIAGHVGH